MPSVTSPGCLDPRSWPASRAASRRDDSSSASPRSWAPCWIAFKSSSRSAGGRFSETASATSSGIEAGDAVTGDVVDEASQVAPGARRSALR